MVSDSEEAETVVANFLLERIRRDHYPSVTQMQLLEQVIPPQLTREYFNVLLAKVQADEYPSIPMIRRIIRIAESL